MLALALLILEIRSIEVNLSSMDSSLIDIVWCGSESSPSDDALVLSSKGSLYRSANKGVEWTKLSENLHRKGLMVLQDEQERVGVVNKIQKSPLDP